MIFVDQDAAAFVAQLTKTLACQPDSELGISNLLEEINRRLGTEAISIFVLDEPHDELVLKYAAGPVRRSILGLRIPSQQGVVGWVVKFNDPLIVPSPGLDTRFFSGIDQKTGFITRSILCVPVVRDDRSVGAIEVLNKTTGSFTDDDLALVRELAATLANTYALLWTVN
ncbi:MAG: GAF domain-containing protein [Thermoflexales bacterium]|nr:GAF domain-containing protein [Thermoflexales bacterium]